MKHFVMKISPIKDFLNIFDLQFQLIVYIIFQPVNNSFFVQEFQG